MPQPGLLESMAAGYGTDSGDVCGLVVVQFVQIHDLVEVHHSKGLADKELMNSTCDATNDGQNSGISIRGDQRSVELSRDGGANGMFGLLALDHRRYARVPEDDVNAVVTRTWRPFHVVTMPLKQRRKFPFKSMTRKGSPELRACPNVPLLEVNQRP